MRNSELFCFSKIKPYSSCVLYGMWSIGLLIGSFCSVWPLGVDTFAVSQMPAMSVAGVFLSSFLPVILASVFIRCRWDFCLFSLVFLRSVLYGFSLGFVCQLPTAACWMFFCAAFLSQSCSCILVLYLCDAYFCNTKHMRLAFYLISLGLICLLDCLLLSKLCMVI